LVVAYKIHLEEQAWAQGCPDCSQSEMPTAASEAGPALGLISVGKRPPGASRIAALQGPFASPLAQAMASKVPQ
jgi:hypothetical protein